MNNKKRAERIIKNVEQMRENSQEMRMWKNIPLAKECVQLLKELDDPEETPMGKALACEAIILISCEFSRICSTFFMILSALFLLFMSFYFFTFSLTPTRQNVRHRLLFPHR